jgi:hypothetical protein
MATDIACIESLKLQTSSRANPAQDAVSDLPGRPETYRTWRRKRAKFRVRFRV